MNEYTPGLTSNEIFKLRTEYSLESLKKIGKIEEIQNEITGMIDVFFNNVPYMSFCPSGPSNESFWIESDIELNEVKYAQMYVVDGDGNKKKNISKLN